VWKNLQDIFLAPTVDDAQLEERLKVIRAKLPAPVFWLLGKTQSGKTSVIKALTGESRAEIGDGVRPCTRHAFVYDFPNPEHRFLRFLDTRGLGEVDYDPSEDIAQFQQQAHLLIVVIKALDHAQQPVIEAVRTIHQHQPQWPIIVLQTVLHEGYPDPTMEHLLPYPYDQDPLPPAVPGELARSLEKQRQLFTGMNVQRFIAVDFTLPEDGYEPVNYGLEALWNAIEEVLPLGLMGMIHDVRDINSSLKTAYSNTAHPHIIGYSIAAAGAGAIPLPFVDIPLVTVIQAKMMHTIASIYKQELDAQRLREIGGALGVSFAFQWGRRELLKIIPGYGTAVSSLLTGASTFALGKAATLYFSYAHQGKAPDPELFRKIYGEQFEEGQRLLKNYLKGLGDQKQP
jgi:uncharacterized protein (DUF697 family)